MYGHYAAISCKLCGNCAADVSVFKFLIYKNIEKFEVKNRYFGKICIIKYYDNTKV